MSMKKLITIILIASSILVVSCKDWLSVSSSTQIKGDDLLSTEEGFEDALTGIYMNLASNNLYGKNLTWYFLEFLSEPYEVRSVNATDFTYVVVDEGFVKTISQSYVNSIWNSMYNTIANINKLIKETEESENILGERAKSIFLGELYSLRAYLHLDLMRLYGYGNYANRDDFNNDVTIPYVTEYSKELTEQKSYNETLNLIIMDFEKGIDYLKNDPILVGDENEVSTEFNSNNYWSNRRSHLNYYAAKALLARAYMWSNTPENIQKAAIIAEEVIAAEGKAYKWTDLNSNETYVNRILFTEQLFSVNVFDLYSSISNYITDLEYNSSAPTEIFDAIDIKNTIFEACKYDDDYNLVFGGIGYDDFRFQEHVRPTTYSYAEHYYSYKLYQTSDEYNPYNNYIPLIKIDEMYYILAEKALLDANEDKALEVINIVRAKHGATQEITQDVIQNVLWSTVKTEFLKELMRSFISEGQLFYYLKRWGVSSYEDEGLYLNNDRSFSDKTYLLPYPIDEITNGNRIQ